MQVLKTKKGSIPLPCMTPIIVPIEKVHCNDYNPNHVPKRKMELLEESIELNGFCFPVVCVYDEDHEGEYTIVDGFHRYTIFKDYLGATEIPIVINARSNPADRMSATVQFNRARGVHGVEEMSDLVLKMLQQGCEEDEIAKELGMELEEVFRLKQVSGIAEIFKNQDYSKSWEMEDVE